MDSVHGRLVLTQQQEGTGRGIKGICIVIGYVVERATSCGGRMKGQQERILLFIQGGIKLWNRFEHGLYTTIEPPWTSSHADKEAKRPWGESVGRC